MHSRRRRTGLIGLSQARGWRQAIASLALVFFAFQSYLTQTHIHLLLRGGNAGYALTGAASAQPAPAHGRLPPADNPATCPICQDMLLAGHFTAPGTIALALPQQVVTPVATVIAIPAFVAAVSHSWHGRAPPQN